MKKKKVDFLKLNKLTVAKLDNPHNVVGGRDYPTKFYRTSYVSCRHTHTCEDTYTCHTTHDTRSTSY